jgi:hypothetical protein
MLKVAVIILVIIFGYSFVVSLMDIIAPKLAMGSMLNALTGETLDNVPANYLKAIKISTMSSGICALSGSIVSLFVLFVSFRKAQKWAWWALLIGGCVTGIGGMILPISIGDKMYSLIYIIGVVIFLVGIFLPIKAFFTKPVN